jgi:LPXTG-motif cell wall-anchored protein
VRKDKYDEYGPEIDGMIKSMRAFRKPGSINDGSNPSGISTDVDITLFPASGTSHPVKPKSDNDSGAAALLILLVAGGGAFIWWKKKKKK